MYTREGERERERGGGGGRGERGERYKARAVHSQTSRPSANQ